MAGAGKGGCGRAEQSTSTRRDMASSVIPTRFPSRWSYACARICLALTSHVPVSYTHLRAHETEADL
eukprot:580379-Rhodomonas_salina.2